MKNNLNMKDLKNEADDTEIYSENSEGNNKKIDSKKKDIQQETKEYYEDDSYIQTPTSQSQEQ